PDGPIERWQDLSDLAILKAAEYWTRTTETLRVLPRARSNAPASYKQALAQLSHCIAGLFDRYFVMPEIENWYGKLNFYAQLADLSYADSLRRYDRITNGRVREAQGLCREYLSFHLPGRIPAR
ncbi:MAG: hypothetical protein ACE5F8_06920, partial [Woeseiaceae bacterium]